MTSTQPQPPNKPEAPSNLNHHQHHVTVISSILTVTEMALTGVESGACFFMLVIHSEKPSKLPG